MRCEQGTQKVGTYSELIKNNIDFEVLLKEHEKEKDLVEEIFQLILEVVMTEKDTVRIANTRVFFNPFKISSEGLLCQPCKTQVEFG